MREIRTLRATWRGLETWNGRDISADRRASPRPYLRARGGEIPPRDSPRGLSIGTQKGPRIGVQKDPLRCRWGCPGSEQEGPARVAKCPHERRSGARGRCLFAHLGNPRGWGFGGG